MTYEVKVLYLIMVGLCIWSDTPGILGSSSKICESKKIPEVPERIAGMPNYEDYTKKRIFLKSRI
jgi:hypothetical protein